jgi:hypothetical protein
MDCERGIKSILASTASTTLASVLAFAIMMACEPAAAQGTQNAPAADQRGFAAAQENPKAQASEQPGFFTAMGHWFDQTVTNFNMSMRNMRERFQSLGQGANDVAKTTVDTARDAADAVRRIPNARVILGHEKCEIAPNGAPDCIAAAYAICKAQGFSSGKSVDMTTSEVCSPQVYLAGRNSGPGCRTETFVSRALCQ